jgi:hypothetical protein
MKNLNSVKQKAKLTEEVKNNSITDFENLIKKTIKLDNITLLSL